MPGPHAAVARTRTAVRATLADDAVAPGSLVLVACSGGPDSLALAAATAFVAPRAGLAAGAVVVDHGVQPGSADVAATAAATCRGLGLAPVEVVAVDVPDGPDGPEAHARAARHAALEDAADRLGAAAVLLGHTLDDQAETVLLGLARGSGARSLAGMPAARGRLRRPFLGLRRADTEAACAAQGLVPWADPTNTSGDPRRGPRRSRVRTHVLPLLEEVLGPGVAEALARTADQLRADADVLDDLAARLLADATRAAAGKAAGHGAPGTSGTPGTPGAGDAADARRVVLDVEVLAAAPPALRTRALRAACLAAGCPAGALGHVHVGALDALVTSWHGQGPVHLPGGRLGVRACGRLTVHDRHDEHDTPTTDDRET